MAVSLQQIFAETQSNLRQRPIEQSHLVEQPRVADRRVDSRLLDIPVHGDGAIFHVAHFLAIDVERGVLEGKAETGCWICGVREGCFEYPGNSCSDGG